jgi:hypothetical protein
VGKLGVAVLIASVATVSACSSANRASSAPTSSTAGSAPGSSTTGRPQPTTTTSTPDFSFDDSVPPPKLINTGKNYVAILKSLGKYSNWLAAHRPEPALTSTILARGTRLYDLYVQDFTHLRDNHKRGIEELGGPSRYKILSATPDAFSAKVVEDIRVHKTVVSTGRVTSQIRFTQPTTYLMLVVLVRDHWFLAGVDVVQQPVNVQG